MENAPPEQNSAAPASAVASPKANDGSSAPAPPEDEAPNRDLRLTPSPTAENQGTAPRNERMDDSSGPPVTLRLSVIHAGLEHASYPIAVGHYNGDVLTGAEWVLDDRLNSKLSSRRAMNLYPGPESTAEVVLAPGLAPPGALVIGLRETGELTSDIVTRGIVVATLRLALARLEEPAEDEGQTGCRAVAFSTLLIGTRGGRALAIESSIAA
ncbi:MAG TPA: hypothetical protein PKE45_05870, partial [Caldilineaceae bacterium]|nr:hypothetical protein [Caldilineaceae bacterium]